MTAGSHRYLHVDALRAVAALLVVWLHSIEFFGRLSVGGDWVHTLAGGSLDLGRVGVVIFFAISGFVIPASLSDAPGAMKRFAVKRFFRLYPAYWVSVLLASALALAIADRADPTPLQFAANLTMVQEFFGVVSVQGLYWTLHVELVFYALCALAWARGLGRAPAFLPAAVVVMLAGFVVCLVLARLGGGKGSAIHTAGMYCLHLSIMFWGAIVRRWYDGASLVRAEQLVLRGVVAGWLVLLTVALVGW
ncbi:MAG: acyltransferase, partial [Rhodocyclaceae bacterium]|nr:acyltransferase [Rhodocyclaceae bacterium]